MTEEQRRHELARLASEAHRAETGSEQWRAGEIWRRYELVRDGGRDPDELLAEGIALSKIAVELARQAEA